MPLLAGVLAAGKDKAMLEAATLAFSLAIQGHQKNTELAAAAGVYTLHPTPYTLHPTPYTLHPTPYTLNLTPRTLHHTPSTLHPTPCTRDARLLARDPGPPEEHGAGGGCRGEEERIFIERMTSDRKLKASREGSK